jgi:hypothetical protein
VNLLVVISVEFMVKNPLSLFDFFDLFSDTIADESVLEPTILFQNYEKPSFLDPQDLLDIFRRFVLYTKLFDLL